MPDIYYELRVKPLSQYELFLSLIIELASDGVEEKDGVIFVRSERDLSDIKAGLQELASKLGSTLGQKIKIETELEKKENKNWIKEYQKGVKPIEVGDFYIHPSWHSPKENKKNILIEPALAFGSGHHESTYGCLQSIGSNVKAGDRVLDVGCGSGILGIASSILGASVDLCDIDNQAIMATKKNFKLNGVNYNKLWQGSLQDTTCSYDVVVANIVADVLIFIKDDLARVLKDDGTLIISGVLDKYINKIKRNFDKMQIIKEDKNSEWYTLVLKKQQKES